jgi:isocitrate dehydrogenase (NAD+)
VGHNVTLIPGDGTGPELTAAACRVLDASGASLSWDVRHVGAQAYEREGSALPDAVLESIRTNGVALKGPVATPPGAAFRSVNIELRRALDLYAQVRPCRRFEGAPSPVEALDVLVIRETTEDLYAGVEYAAGAPETAELIGWLSSHGHAWLRPESAISVKPISEWSTRRIFRFAFEYARSHRRRRVTAVHKAAVMKHTDGLFRDVARDVARDYPDLEFDDRAVDTLALQFVRRPAELDVLVAPNLYGDILSDLAAGLVGGLGLAPGANIGEGIAVFEAAHGTAPAHAGKDRANPIALVLCGVLLLRHLGEDGAAERVETAVSELIADGEHLTYDLRGGDNGRPPARTSELADALVARLSGAGRPR